MPVLFFRGSRHLFAKAEALAERLVSERLVASSRATKRQGENGAAAWGISNAYSAAMGACDLGNDGEAETGAGVALAGTSPEALEYMASVFGPYTRPVVCDADSAIEAYRHGYFRIGRRMS